MKNIYDTLMNIKQKYPKSNTYKNKKTQSGDQYRMAVENGTIVSNLIKEVNKYKNLNARFSGGQIHRSPYIEYKPINDLNNTGIYLVILFSEDDFDPYLSLQIKVKDTQGNKREEFIERVKFFRSSLVENDLEMQNINIKLCSENSSCEKKCDFKIYDKSNIVGRIIRNQQDFDHWLEEYKLIFEELLKIDDFRVKNYKGKLDWKKIIFLNSLSRKSTKTSKTSRKTIKRNPAFVQAALEMAKGICQDSDCQKDLGWTSKAQKYSFLEVDHIIPLEGSEKNDILENMIAICPNCHSKKTYHSSITVKKDLQRKWIKIAKANFDLKMKEINRDSIQKTEK